MVEKAFHHALKVNREVCIACAHCIKACPTEAIRMRNGKAVISDNKCIDCGECYRVCPASAIYIEQDDFDDIMKYKHRVALVPAVLMGQFASIISTDSIYAAILEAGFTHVYEVENSSGILLDFMKEYIAKHNDTKPLISCFCPAIVRLIQVRFPALCENLIQLKQSIDLSAAYFKQTLIDKGIDEKEIGIFFITPCAAKIAAVKSPVGEEFSAINGVINLDMLYNRISKHLNTKHPELLQEVAQTDHVSAKGVLWTLTHGEQQHMQGRCLAVDGIENVIEFLEKLEDGAITGTEFLELRACDESCAGGILTIGNRFITVERLKKRARDFEQDEERKEKNKDIEHYRDLLYKQKDINPIEPRSTVMLDTDKKTAFEKMKKARHLMCFLPGVDCGVCGASTCTALAEDIVHGEANLSDCVFIQKLMEENKKLSPDHSMVIIKKIWGEKRFEKNCKKKGAEDESF